MESSSKMFSDQVINLNRNTLFKDCHWIESNNLIVEQSYGMYTCHVDKHPAYFWLNRLKTDQALLLYIISIIWSDGYEFCGQLGTGTYYNSSFLVKEQQQSSSSSSRAAAAEQQDSNRRAAGQQQQSSSRREAAAEQHQQSSSKGAAISYYCNN